MSWLMSRLNRVCLSTEEALVELSGPRWVYVETGELLLSMLGSRNRIGAADAVLLDASTSYRLVAAVDSVVVVADLHASGRSGVPSPLIVRHFAARHPGLTALVGSCPQQGPGTGTAHFTESYGNLIAAAMTASWHEDSGRPEETDPVVDAIVSALTVHPEETWSVERMAELVHLSRSALGERFRRSFGLGPMEVLRQIRMDRARGLLRDGTLRVESIASRVGYGSAAAFVRAFVAQHGLPPQQWRESQLRVRASGDEGAGRAAKPALAAIATTAPTINAVLTP
ncbi:helix-turn-helix transcriptional regulator [Humibacter ginsenosidimutans]|uniref:Helix-turn-helix transcriptional regulator n=2 Tax=Humibacter ginsenosidimutans TaxID=2599293 RepID=A0A5B8MAD6_9MICO|nr:helix-turn-helix transcriptional regulator [Humibacter ginsenosidimutans]